MRSFVFLSLAAVASAADFVYPIGLVGTPGLATLTPKCAQNATGSDNDCPAQLPSGNVLIPAYHQAISEANPDKDSTADSNALAINFYRDRTELRSLAIIPDFPKSAEGKQCIFHLFSNGGTAETELIFDRIAVWSLKPGKVANLETTWNTRPERDQKVAVFAHVDPLDKSRPQPFTKYEWPGIEGSAHPLTKSFDCPKGGSHVAWEVALDVDLSALNPPIEGFGIINLGGINGLGIEVLDLKQAGYVGYVAPSSTTSFSASSPSATSAFVNGFKYPTDRELEFIPGTDRVSITPDDCVNDITLTRCVTKLASGNIIVPAYHQAIIESQPDTDSTASNNGVQIGIYQDKTEQRTIAIIPSFPSSGEGKQCSFHFITNGGANLASDAVPSVALWSLKSTKNANLEATWNTRPERDQKVAVWDLPRPYVNQNSKFDHVAIEGPAFPLSKTFDCPKPGSLVAWELAINVDKEQFIKDGRNTDRLFAGGMLGLHIEIIGAKQNAYGQVATLSIAAPSGHPFYRYFCSPPCFLCDNDW